MQVRKVKKAVNSDTALNAIVRQLSLCAENNTTANEAMIIAIENSWKTVKPEWIENLKNNSGGRGQQKPFQERKDYKFKPSSDFEDNNPDAGESVLEGEFMRISV